jgi:3-oxoacyl-[acyl-carrier protein] reductase
MDGDIRLDGKSAVVVGAAQGIGRATALCFAGAGAHVLCADIDEEGARVTAAQA